MTDEILEKAKEKVREVTAIELLDVITTKNSPIIFDIRDSTQRNQGIISGALSVDQPYIELDISSHKLDYDHPIVVYCTGGRNSLLACKALVEMGYKNARSLQGGFTHWKDKELPIDIPERLTDDEQLRYQRHLSLPKIGTQGQLKLKKAKVALVGIGGLGSPIALYLAAAGIGDLCIIDGDTVEESNLQRQVIHNMDTVGLHKVDSATNYIRKLNPFVNINSQCKTITQSNAKYLLEGYDIVVDGSDNFDTRYAVNDAVITNGQILVSASIFQFTGQVSSFDTSSGTPCYQCLFPERPAANLAPSCSSAGVIGALAGVVGLMQAMEVLKIILGIGNPLFRKLLTYDGLTSKTQIFSYKLNSKCTACQQRDEDTQKNNLP